MNIELVQPSGDSAIFISTTGKVLKYCTCVLSICFIVLVNSLSSKGQVEDSGRLFPVSVNGRYMRISS